MKTSISSIIEPKSWGAKQLSNLIYDKKFYNEEQKSKYLSQFTGSTYDSYSRVLSRAYDLENILNKDLYEFSRLEIERLIKILAPKSTESVKLALSTVKLYVRWAIDKNLTKNDSNPLEDEMTGRNYEKTLVDYSIKMLFTYDEVLDVVDRLINFQDKAVVLALFEGFHGKKFSELLNLKKSDIPEGNVLLLTDEDESQRQLTISDKLKTILLEATSDQVYYKRNGEVSDNIRNSDTLQLVESPNVIKHSNTNSKAIQSEAHTINRRYKMISEYFMLPGFTPNNIRTSGMLYEAMKKYVASKGSEITPRDYQDICNKYRIATKGKHGYLYLKRKSIDEETIGELYGLTR